MAYRYSDRSIMINKNQAYRKILKDRGLKQITQFDTAEFGYPTSTQMQQLTSIPHVWKMGDKYYKLAHKHYGDPTLWWVIAWYNKKPTEGHIKAGDVLYIPTPLDMVLSFI